VKPIGASKGVGHPIPACVKFMIGSSVKPLRALVIAKTLLAGCCFAAAGPVFEQVKSAGVLACGVVTEEADYTKDDTHGNLAALGLDTCKAVAAAVFGDGAKVRITAFPDEHHGLTALKSRQIALLAGATPTVVNGALFGVGFARPIFFDGQGFLVAKTSGIRTLDAFADKQICFIAGTEAETVLGTLFADRGIKYLPFPFEEEGEMEAALVTGHCAAITADASSLAAARANFHARIDDFVILPELITLDPLAPAYAEDDAQWAAVVDATVQALIQAEASGITRGNVDARQRSSDPSTARLLTGAGGLGRALSLDREWAVRVIETVGNYGEMFERDVGMHSALRLERGRNALWTKGGLMYPLPVR
jgi:general L-amino acid transport system substrate-binding protein